MALKKGVPLGRVALAPWFRGSGWIDGSDVVMDYEQPTSYQPLTEPKLAIELTHVSSPETALAFAQRFGLLDEHPAIADADLRRRGLPVSRRDWFAREPIAYFLETAETLRRIVRTAADVRHAIDIHADPPDRREALDRLRKKFGDANADDRKVLVSASAWCAWGLNDGLVSSNASPYVYDRAQMGENVDPGRIRIGILPDSLRGFCFLLIAYALSEKEPLEICRQCEAVFVVEDARQIYCTPYCASRYRSIKFQRKRELKKHAKQTRTGRR